MQRQHNDNNAVNLRILKTPYSLHITKLLPNYYHTFSSYYLPINDSLYDVTTKLFYKILLSSALCSRIFFSSYYFVTHSRRIPHPIEIILSPFISAFSTVSGSAVQEDRAEVDSDRRIPPESKSTFITRMQTRSCGFYEPRAAISPRLRQVTQASHELANRS